MIRMVWAGFRNPIRNVITNRNISQTFARSEKSPVTASSEPVTKQDTSLSKFIVTNP
jgi:hypothetical protein